MTTDGMDYLRKLRNRAEALISSKGQSILDTSPDEIRQLAHDLAVHQVELEIQNEELQAAYQRVDAALGRYARLYHSAPVGFLTLDENGVILQCNQTFLEMLGEPAADLVGSGLADLLESPGREIFLARYRAILNSPEGKTLEARLKRKDRKVLDVRFTARLEANSYSLAEEARSSRQILLAANDITQEIQAVQGLRESEARHRSMLRAALDGVMLTDREGRFVAANDAACNILGYSRDELLGMAIPDIDLTENVPETQRHLARIIENGADIFHSVLRRADGRGVDVELSATYLEDSQQFLAYIRDITDRKLAEKALHESEILLRTTVEAAPIVLFTLNTEGVFTLSTGAGLKLLGLEPGQVVGLSHFDMYKDLESANENVRRALKGEAVSFIYEAMGVVWDVHYAPLYDNEHQIQGMIGTAVDITDRRRAELEMRQLESQLQHLQRMESIGRLASGIAHDMNNVMAAIMAVATVIHLRGGEHAKQADLILEATRRGRDLVQGLMTFARKEVQDVDQVDLNELVRKEAELLASTTLKKIRIELDLTPGLPKLVGSQTALSTSLMNLCMNAVDAMPEGGTLTLRTRLEKDRMIELTVEDTGEGMPAEVISRAMEPFFTTKPVGKGTGLGLSIVYGTVRAHGGSIEIQSGLGNGTRIRVRLPMGPSLTPKLMKIPGQSISEPGKGLRILLVDDDPLVRDAAPVMLESQGHQVTVADGGRQAIGLIDHGGWFDIVVLDLNMPDLDGVATLEQLRQIRPDLPVLITTGFADDLTRKRLSAYPRVGILPKPYTIEEIQAKFDSEI